MASHRPRADQSKPCGRLSPLCRSWLHTIAGPFLQGLAETGYVEGRNVAIEYRWAGGHYDRLAAMAADLVARKVDLIAAFGPPPARAAKNATSTIPIVFEVGNDAVEAGLVESLARPGGNATGLSILFTQLTSKRLELLCELVPQARTIALLVNPNSPTAEPSISGARQAALAKGVQLSILKAGTDPEIDAAFATSSTCKPTNSSSPPIRSSMPGASSL